MTNKESCKYVSDLISIMHPSIKDAYSFCKSVVKGESIKDLWKTYKFKNIIEDKQKYIEFCNAIKHMFKSNLYEMGKINYKVPTLLKVENTFIYCVLSFGKKFTGFSKVDVVKVFAFGNYYFGIQKESLGYRLCEFTTGALINVSHFATAKECYKFFKSKVKDNKDFNKSVRNAITSATVYKLNYVILKK